MDEDVAISLIGIQIEECLAIGIAPDGYDIPVLFFADELSACS